MIWDGQHELVGRIVWYPTKRDPLALETFGKVVGVNADNQKVIRVLTQDSKHLEVDQWGLVQ